MIIASGAQIKEIFVGASSVGKVYVGSSLVWQKGGEEETPTNVFDGSLSDLWAYLRYANLSFNTTTAGTNLVARCAVKANTTYKVEMLMDNRFRVFSYKGQPANATIISGVLIDVIDDNGSVCVNELRELTITTGSDHNMLYIGYWTSTGSLSSEDIRNTIKVTEVETNE